LWQPHDAWVPIVHLLKLWEGTITPQAGHLQSGPNVEPRWCSGGQLPHKPLRPRPKPPVPHKRWFLDPRGTQFETVGPKLQIRV
jgi:hypothetical protein